VVVNAFVGAMVGLERSILPAIAEQDFHLAARAAVLSFIVVFGVTKALTNYLAGRFSDAVGRKTVPLAAIYPGVRGMGQLVTGALSDRGGRKWLIASGMWIQAVGIAVVATSSRFAGFAVGGVLLGAGTAMVYPTLLAAIGDVAHPTWRASSVGVYRLWRDLGYAVGALLAGVTADALGVPVAISLVATVTFASGWVVALRMRETRRREAI
jgi:MFS family permease